MYAILSICRGGGYHYARTEPRHPRANSKGLYPLHRVVAENVVGRSLARHEHVHHIDGDRDNNDPTNLEVLTASEHGREHARTVDPIDAICPECNTTFTRKPHQLRQLASRKKGAVCCSRSCGTRHAHRLRAGAA